MGCVFSRFEIDTEAKARSKKIQAEIDADERERANEVKLLLLGAGESGKTTIMKQFKLKFSDGFDERELQRMHRVVHLNTIQSMDTLLRGMDMLDLEFGYPESAALVQRYRQCCKTSDSVVTPEIGAIIIRLWNDPGVQLCYRNSNRFQLNDSAEYFITNSERIGNPNYVVTIPDALRTRVKTTGINECIFYYGGKKFRVFDVGGQRSERRKWIHCFENVTAIIFCAALSEYDQLLREHDTNRMRESLDLFESICNNHWFAQTSIILFLNKKDIFAQKIKISPLKTCFPDYHGSDNYAEACTFVERKFCSLNRNPKKTIYVHDTIATDEENICEVFAAVTDIILRANLESIGLF